MAQSTGVLSNGRDGVISTFVDDAHFSCLFPNNSGMGQRSFDGGNSLGSSPEGRRKSENVGVSTENSGQSSQRRRSRKPTPVEDVEKVSSVRRLSGSHRGRQLLSPTKKSAHSNPSKDAAPEGHRGNQLCSPPDGDERSNAGRRSVAERDVFRESLATTRARVRDLQRRGGPQQQNNRRRQLAAAEKRKDDLRSQDSAVFIGHSEQILSLAHRKDILFSAAADGTAKVG